MKLKHLAIIYTLASCSLAAQVPASNINQSTTYSDNSIGNLVAETPFGAKLYTANNIPAQELIDNLINKFKGKALYLDFWALWCPPCIEQMPYSKRLHAETEGLPVEFIYFCTSRNTFQFNWQSKILTFKQPGIHIFIDDTHINEIMRLFSVGGYPSYVFINTKGIHKPGLIEINAITPADVLKELIKNK